MPLDRKDWRSVRQIVQERLGHERLRPGQKEALEALLQGRDTLAVLPTGSGKSAIYQIAALMLDGPTVVVSPLIALQRDQVEAILESDLGNAAVVNSSLAVSERREAFDVLEQEDLEFLLLAPEQFGNEETLERVRAAKPSLFVVDEAHCVSEWGHDFRPDYLRLGAVIEALGHPRTLALTATAAPDVRREIIERLHLRDPAVIVTGFDRPNIHLSVVRMTGERLKLEATLNFVRENPCPGIIYAGTRKHTEQLAQALSESGIGAVAYHAGLKRDDRNGRQSAFMNGEVDVMVATTAFGMGVDKPDVRFVLHYHVSDSLDAYYQEVGRAGRDGEPAKALLLYSNSDLNLKRFLTSSGRLAVEDVERVLAVAREQPEPVAPKALAKLAGLSQAKTSRAIARLEEQGVLERLPTGEVVPPKLRRDAASVAERSVDAQEERREGDRNKIELMRAYAELKTCRRKFLLEYFGDQFEAPCGACDNCDHPLMDRARAAEPRPEPRQDEKSTPPTEEEHPFAIDERVTHKTLGAGTVVAYEGETGNHIVVEFDTSGKRQLDLALVRAEALLARGG